MSAPGLIIEIKRHSSGQLQAFADVTLCGELGECTIYGCRVLCSAGQEPWVAFPTVSYQREGKTQHKEVVSFSRGLRKQITDGILSEYRRVVAA